MGSLKNIFKSAEYLLTIAPLGSKLLFVDKTALWPIHQSAGAKFVDFSGYEMPVQYKSIIQEHMCVREDVGLFDVSHMGLFSITGPGALNFLNALSTKDLSKIPAGKASYNLVCNHDGYAIDDLICYHLSENNWQVIANAGNKHKVAEHFLLHKKYFDINLSGPSDNHTILALQGPKSKKLLHDLGFSPKIWPKAFSVMSANLSGVGVSLAFTGYTGEIGCEIIVENPQASRLWQLLVKHGEPYNLKACGLGARDTLRTEMAYTLFGHELNSNINPIEANLSWVISFKKENFIGKAALLKFKENRQRKIIGLVSPTAQAPRSDMLLYDQDKEVIGKITSGCFSPCLKKGIALAITNCENSSQYFYQNRQKWIELKLSATPFIEHQKKPEGDSTDV